jgi:dTDP-4-amino-4,6-dideoxygalactose transaminase
MIPFNKPYMAGPELEYIAQAVASGKLSGDGCFTKKCHSWLENSLGSGRSLLTTSCTDALEASALLAKLQPGDEVIMPSFTFVSTANAFYLRGVNIRFIDSSETSPNMDTRLISELINERTRAIIPVHYAGHACEMDEVMFEAKKHDLLVVEDAAQAINSSYRGIPLGTIGDMATFSFHETKNLISGEGGALHINRESLFERAEIVREKGTNRSSFFRGETNKYGWVDIGSSFLPSEITAAFLYAQFEASDRIQAKRLSIWNLYFSKLSILEAHGDITMPKIADYASNNAHMFYITCASLEIRSSLIEFLRSRGVTAVFHYQSLHASEFYADKHDGRELPNSDRYSDCLLRLPLFYELSDSEVDMICDHIIDFFQ